MKNFYSLKSVLLGAAMTFAGVTAFGQNTYKLVTSSDQLKKDSEFIVTNGNTGNVKVLGKQANNNRPAASIDYTVSDSKTIELTPATTSTDESSAYAITLDLNSTTQKWILKDAVNNTILGPATSGNNNHLKANPNATYEIEVNASGVASLKAVTGTTSNRINIRFNQNGTSPIFASYATGQSDVYLFVKEENTPTCTNPEITTQPTDVTVAPNASASFAVVTDEGDYTFQWEESTDGETFTAIDGATTSTLEIANATLEMNENKYRVIVSNGTCTVVSEVATLTVDETLAVGDVNAAKKLVVTTSVSNEIIFGAKANVTIVNMNGQVVKTANVAEGTRLNVANLTPGMYVVTAVVNGKAVSQKIIKK